MQRTWWKLLVDKPIVPGDSLNFDCNQIGLTTQIQSLWFQIAGEVTAAGGGAVSGLTRLAPSLMLKRVQLQGSNPSVFSGQANIFFDSGDILYLLGSFNDRTLGLKQAPAPLAAASANFVCNYKMPLCPFDGNPLCAMDFRTYTNAQLLIDVGVLTDYASTNVASIQKMRLRIYALQVVDAPNMNAMRFEPQIDTYIHQPIVTSNEDKTKSLADGALVAYQLFQALDFSGVGDAQMSDALIGRLFGYYGGVPIYQASWADMIVQKSRMERGLSLAAPADYPPGVAIWLPGEYDNPATWIDTRKAILDIGLDTQFAPMQNVNNGALVTPAAGDNFKIVSMKFRPNAAMAAQIA